MSPSTYQKLLNHARKSSPRDYEDDVQDLCLRLLENGRFADCGEPLMFHTLRWVIIDGHRKRSRFSAGELAEVSVRTVLDESILVRQVLESEPHAHLLIASEIEGESNIEIAARLGSTPGAVALAKHRLKRRIRAVITAPARSAYRAAEAAEAMPS